MAASGCRSIPTRAGPSRSSPRRAARDVAASTASASIANVGRGRGTEDGPHEVIEGALELVDPPFVRDHHQQPRQDRLGRSPVVLAEHQETVQVAGLLDARDHRWRLPDAIVARRARRSVVSSALVVPMLHAREHSEYPRLAPHRAHPRPNINPERCCRSRIQTSLLVVPLY